MINSIGFQMSVLAVAGIMLLYQPVINFFELFVKNKSKLLIIQLKHFQSQ
jgi:predicted membrane metal-binding protein